MPIVNTVIAGEGGGQGGGDTVTALVGANASGIDVGDKVILNYPAVNEKGYCSEYRFQNQTGTSGQWSIFFGEYMMYVDISGHPVFLKHDTVNDKLIYLGKDGSTLDVFPTGTNGLSNTARTKSLKITYNESTKRFATCKGGSLKLYQATIDESNGVYGIEQIASFSTVDCFGGIAQDTDTVWYLPTITDPDSLVVQDFTYSGNSFVALAPYLHTNNVQTLVGSIETYNFGCFMSPCLKAFAFSDGGSSTSSNGTITGALVDKENNTITYSSGALSVPVSNYGSTTTFSYTGYTWNICLNDDGVGVFQTLSVNGSNNGVRASSSFSITLSSVSLMGSITYTSNLGYRPYAYHFHANGQPGSIHKVGDWIVNGAYTYSINSTTGSYGRVDPVWDIYYGNTYYEGGLWVASLSSTGVFIWPYCSQSESASSSYTYYLSKFNGGTPVRSYPYITPLNSLTYPYYFDGNFLYASGGIFATDGAGSLTYLGNSGSLSGSWGSENYHRYFPPTYTSNGICFGYGQTRSGLSYFGLMFFSSGAYTGAFNGWSGTSQRSLLLDARFDSTNTGFASLMPVVDYNNYEAHLVYVSNGLVTVKADNAYFPFFTENGDCYAASWTTDKFYKATCDGSTITYTDLGSSGIVEAMFGAATSEYTYRAVQSSRKDDYQFWYRAGNSIKGFTHIDTTNNTIAQVTTPSALDAVKGTVYAVWWDLDNRLFIRTSTGLFVFAYTNHDISTMQLVKKFEWSTDYSGSASCSPDLMSYAAGNDTYVKVISETVMPVYEFSANKYNGQNFAGTSLTGFVNEAITTDPWGQSIVEVNTVKDPADTWTNVGTPFGFDVSTTSSDVSVGWGYYNSGSAEVIFPSTVTKTLAQVSDGQTTGFKNDVVVYKDNSDNCSDLICKTGTTPVGTFKVSTALSTNVYLSDDKTAIAGTSADSGFGVSYTQASDVNYAYTVEGSATVVDGVASNFGTNDYIKFSSDFGTPTSFEFGCKIRIPSTWDTGTSCMYWGLCYSDASGISLSFTTDSDGGTKGRMRMDLSSTAGSWASTTYSTYGFQTSTDYYIRIVWNGSYWYAYYSLDGVNYTQIISKSMGSWISAAENYFILGTSGSRGRAHPFTGSIYLNDCYMNVNGSLWWSPAADPYGSVTVSDGYHYNNETDAPFYLGSDLTRTATQMVVHSEDFVAQSTDVPDYTVVGSPTITSKVASGFSSSNYITGPTFDSNQSFEIVSKIKQTSTRTAACQLFGTNTYGLFIGINGSNQLYFNVGNGSSWAGTAPTGSSISANTDYWVKCTRSGSTLTLYSSTDGSTWTTEGTIASSYSNSATFAIGARPEGTNSFTDGSVDLSETYIKVNGSTVWTPYKTEVTKQGTLFLSKPTATTTTSIVSANSSPTASYAGSVVTPVSLGKTVTMDSTLTKILAVEDSA